MTLTFGKTLAACVAVSTLAFASSAHAGNAFNKFPTHPAAPMTQGLQVSTYVVVTKTTANVATTKRRLKRVVQPVPTTLTPRISYASDHGTANMKRGFNKMVPQTNMSPSAMPVIVDHRAYSAR